MSYYCEDENITDPGKIALKILRGIGNAGLKRLNASGTSDSDKKRPDKIWELFESQLKTNLNFRVHRLHLTDYRQRSEESVDDFVTRARTQTLKCEFEESELKERIIEHMIASTPIEAFQRELLGKAKGYKLTDTLAEGGRSEAIPAGRQEIQKRTSTPLNNVDQVGQACGSCGRAHPPRACPAYRDSCKLCGKIGDWKNCCRKRKGTNRPKEDVEQRGDTKSDGKQRRDAGKGSRRRDRRFHDLEPAASYTSEEDSTEPYDCIRISSVRNEVFTTLDVICPRKKGMRKIKLKVDTGAAGNTPPLSLRTYRQMYNTLPLRTYKQMYKTLPPKNILEPTRNVKLVAYNGQEIPCLGSINLQLRFGKQKSFTKAKFYVVDVPSAPIVGLPTCKKIGLVTIHCDDLRPKPDVTTVEGLKQAYPGQFDTLADFRGVAKLHLKQDSEPFIDPPRKCSIHLKEKLNAS